MNNSLPGYKHMEMKKSILDSLLIIILIVGLPNLIIFTINSHKAGNFPYFSTTGLSIILIFVVLRKKVPYAVKAWTLIAFGYLIGTVGLSREGLLSDGLLYYVFISILSSMLINIWSGIFIMIVSIITTSVIVYGISKHWLEYSFDIASYFHAPETWLAFIFTLAFFTAMAVYIYGRLERYLVQYIHELTEKSGKLNLSNIQLEKEMEERKQAEYQLIQSEIKFKSIFNSMGDGIVLLGNDHTLLDANDSFLRLTGKTRESVLQKPLGSFFYDSGKLKKFFQPNPAVSSIFNKNEFQLKSTREKKTLPVEIAILPFQVAPEIIQIALVKDITDKKEMEIKIMNAVITSEEEERMRIAQDLHDGVGPYLSAMKLYLNSFGIDDKDSKSLAIKKELLELVNLSINSIREISGNLGSHVLRSLGLKTALDDYINKVRIEDAFLYESNLPKHYPFTDQVEIALYRVMIELINNSLKYGMAGKIEIMLNETQTQLALQYHENGIGFNLQEALEHPKGMGLYNIHSRIHSIGGIVEFNSAPGKGVMVDIIFSKAIACRAT